jgi:hypothetical protein
MMVIDLHSLRQRLVQSDGLLNRLRENASLLRKWSGDEFVSVRSLVIDQLSKPDPVREEIERVGAQKSADAMNASLARLVGANPATADSVDQLIKRFIKDTEEIDRDRNHVRAHRYERPEKLRAKSFQTFAAYAKHFETIEAYLQDLYRVLRGMTYAFELEHGSDHGTTANDLADVAVLGSIQSAISHYDASFKRHEPGETQLAYWQGRESWINKG